jgi:hypothetical protein
MMGLTRGLQSLTKQVNVQTNIEMPSAALTLTRSGTLAITTAGTVITWQVETRNNGFNWSGTDITIPTSGYYAINFVYGTVTVHNTAAFIRVGGSRVAYLAASTGPGASAAAFTAVRYMTTGDVLSLQVFPTVNATIYVAAEPNFESPILHIVQLTGAV